MPSGQMHRLHESPKRGQKISNWKFIREIICKDKNWKRLWQCRCLGCNKVFTRDANQIWSGKSTECQRCAFYNYQNRVKEKWKSDFDIMIDKKLKVRWRHCRNAIIGRCTNKNDPAYNYYGGRGISVHPTFLDRKKFAEFIVTLPGWDDLKLTLDRMNNDGNYEPGNLRMATRKLQANNRRPMSSNPWLKRRAVV